MTFSWREMPSVEDDQNILREELNGSRNWSSKLTVSEVWKKHLYINCSYVHCQLCSSILISLCVIFMSTNNY